MVRDRDFMEYGKIKDNLDIPLSEEEYERKLNQIKDQAELVTECFDSLNSEICSSCNHSDYGTVGRGCCEDCKDFEGFFGHSGAIVFSNQKEKQIGRASCRERV